MSSSRPSPHPDDRALHAFDMGVLDGRAAEQVKVHLRTCEACRNKLKMRVVSTIGVDEVPDRAATVADAIPPELLALEQYEVRRLLGGGGMGVVYLAYNKYMKRLEALKVINKDLLEKRGVFDCFLREIAAAGRLDHTNVATAYTALPAGPSLVFAMQYVDGEDLASMVKSKGPLTVELATHYVYQAALGLQHAHEKGMVHRDIKPQNIMVMFHHVERGLRPVVKLLDFGLAKAVSEEASGLDLTGANMMLGTPQYIAPEQARDAQKADIRADIYGLGCTLYFLLTGRPPFQSSSLTGLLLAHQQDTAKPVNVVRPAIPAELASLVGKMMAKLPSDRHQTPGEVAKALAPFFRQGSKRAPSPQPDVGLETTRERPQLARTVIETETVVRKDQAKHAAPKPLDLNDLVIDERPVARPHPPWPLLGLVAGVVVLALVLGYIVGQVGKEKGSGLVKAPDPEEREVIRPAAPPPSVTSPSWVGMRAGELKTIPFKDQEIKLRWCPPGSFTMGSPTGEKDRDKDEDQVNVTLTKCFWMMETELTQGLWQAVGGPKLDWSQFGGSPDLPVYNVSHTEAEAFAKALTKQLHEAGQLPTGMNLALPTEAQWEYAARAGSTYRFSFGEDEGRLGDYAWYSGNKVHPVGLKRANDWGLKDMAGNVREWCADGYGDKPPGGVDPVGPTGAPGRVFRGGSWDDATSDCRSAARFGLTPGDPSSLLGFRVAAVQAGP
jgi:serine/threonine protein kinase